MKTDTPKTDKEPKIRNAGETLWVSENFAKTLERENARLKSERDAWELCAHMLRDCIGGSSSTQTPKEIKGIEAYDILSNVQEQVSPPDAAQTQQQKGN